VGLAWFVQRKGNDLFYLQGMKEIRQKRADIYRSFLNKNILMWIMEVDVMIGIVRHRKEC